LKGLCEHVKAAEKRQGKNILYRLLAKSPEPLKSFSAKLKQPLLYDKSAGDNE
jgi:hypothetical protein